MRYTSFRIQHFKGIKDTTVSFQTVGGAAVFAFVGLNESGKTTILEAIHSFCPDAATSELVGGDERTGVPYKDRVPRHLISTFTGDVSVIATLAATEADKASIIKDTLTEGLLVDAGSFSSTIVFERQQRFENGDFKGNFFTLRSDLKVRTSKQRKWRPPEGQEEMILIRNIIFNHTPSIAYFPTFVFEFPETAFLTDRGGSLDRFYRRAFQDILDYDGLGHTIEKDIIRRVRGTEMVMPWLALLTAGLGTKIEPRSTMLWTEQVLL